MPFRHPKRGSTITHHPQLLLHDCVCVPTKMMMYSVFPSTVDSLGWCMAFWIRKKYAMFVPLENHGWNSHETKLVPISGSLQNCSHDLLRRRSVLGWVNQWWFFSVGYLSISPWQPQFHGINSPNPHLRWLNHLFQQSLPAPLLSVSPAPSGAHGAEQVSKQNTAHRAYEPPATLDIWKFSGSKMVESRFS